MSRPDDVKLITGTMGKVDDDMQDLIRRLSSEGSMRADINAAVDKALNSLDALKGVIKIVKVK
jgi:hypothetical protein